ncbi:molybdopterin-guanine dinucleotide biosynthesis protein B [Herminiimonas arsenicoxydans]|uniref:Molybdopterin-guanine dinucleotide biosynthesis protein B n=1 Tax=Herminiimonas arsenicoxydans TaxID=204773 RepID=A4G5M6_HERAR|nr:molybdopterin-guanine dinucleotide biosynthesis protein B [Herminiimonas arsenicoxydans]
MTANIIGIAGWSGSGKTTLLEYLLPQLAARGLRVNVIKHSHHDLVLEDKQKDSARARAAGAVEVLVSSPFRFALMHELRGEPEPTLAEHVQRMAPADLTLVEGYKWEPIPKIEVYRPSHRPAALYVDNPDVVAVASDAPAPAGLSRELAWLDLNQPEQVLQWLLAYIDKNKYMTRDRMTAAIDANLDPDHAHAHVSHLRSMH